METSYLTLYDRLIENERLPSPGLCNTMILPDEIKPTFEDLQRLSKEYKPTTYWGYDISFDNKRYDRDDKLYGFNELRQTLVLLAAAINGEFDKKQTFRNIKKW